MENVIITLIVVSGLCYTMNKLFAYLTICIAHSRQMETMKMQQQLERMKTIQEVVRQDLIEEEGGSEE